MDTLLSLEDISLSRPSAGGAIQPILRGISAQFPRSGVTAVLGPSGAGKSSLLRLLNRLEDPTSGSILFNQKPLSGYPVRELRRRIGMVFQLPALFSGTVRDNLNYSPSLWGRSLDSTAVSDLLARVDLSAELADRSSQELSIGQQQRVAIARALANGPEVLLMDEPTSALDPTTAAHVLNLLSELRQELGLTIIFVTHLLQQAEKAADHVLFLVEGERAWEGPAADFFASEDPGIMGFLKGEFGTSP